METVYYKMVVDMEVRCIPLSVSLTVWRILRLLVC